MTVTLRIPRLALALVLGAVLIAAARAHVTLAPGWTVPLPALALAAAAAVCAAGAVLAVVLILQPYRRRLA